MTRLRRLPWLPVLLAVATVAADADVAAVKKVCRADIESMILSIVRGKFDAVTGQTHPTVVARMGGPAKMTESMAKAAAEAKAGGFSIVSGTVEDPADPVWAGHDLYVVVPYSMRLKTRDGYQRQHAYVIGLSHDGGKTFKYVNGDLSPAVIKSVLPNLPAGLKLPPRRGPTVEGK